MNPRLYLCAILLFAVSGCAPKPTLVGQWAGATPGPDGKPIPLHLTLKSDNTFTLDSGGATPDYSGTYTVKDNTLTESATGYSVAGKPMTIPAGIQHAQASTFTLSTDTLTLTPQGGGPATTFTRQKGQ